MSASRRSLSLSFAVALALLGASPSAAAADGARGGRPPIDEDELRTMRAANPHAAELFDRGETLLAAGALAEADASFRRATASYPSCSLPWRLRCEVETRLGQRGDAVAACTTALETTHSNGNLLALVHALVGGPTRPTSRDVYQALAIAYVERDRAPGLLTPVAATCDIAERIGDGVMLERCAEDLLRIAPDAPETRHVEAVLEARCPDGLFWGGWLLVLSSAGLTFGHALLGVARRRRRTVAAIAAGLVVSSVAAPAHADPAHGLLSKWPVDDAHPETAIPAEKDRNADPMEFGYWLQDVALKGERARTRGDHAAAARFYNALALAVPDRAVAFAKMCDEYEALGDHVKAIDECGAALLRDGLTVRDYARFVELVLAQPGELDAKQRSAVSRVLAHMNADPTSRAAATDLECRFGARTSDVPMLKECASALASTAPRDPKTVSYRWALAVAEGDFGAAARLVDEAGAAGMAGEGTEGMRRVTEAAAARRRVHVALFALAAALLVGALAALGAAGRGIRRKRAASSVPASI